MGDFINYYQIYCPVLRTITTAILLSIIKPCMLDFYILLSDSGRAFNYRSINKTIIDLECFLIFFID